MARVEWNTSGERYYEVGVDRGVLYPQGSGGVAWNGLTSVNETPSGAELSSYYVDGIKVLDVVSSEEFKATIEAFTYPEEFELYDGYSQLGNGLYVTNQERNTFGLCYRTFLGNDVSGIEHGYKLHLIYNAIATPSSRSNTTLGDSIDPISFSWNISAKPTYVPGSKHSAHIIIESTTTEPKLLAALEDVLYGKYDTPPRLPSPEQLVDYYAGDFIFRVVDHKDGTYSVISTDEFSHYIDATTFELSKDSVVSIDPNTFTATSS